MAVTSLRRKLSVGAALGLILVPGCHAVEHALPYAEAIRTPLDEVPGLKVGHVSVETDHSVVGYRYPILGGSHPLTVEARTAMAERQTAFLEELSGRGRPELQQDATLLAASSEVVGARITAVSSAGMRESLDATTLWYDAENGNVLPWTSLFRDEQAIEQAHLLIADVLRDGYNLPLEQLPGVVGEVALRAEEETETPSAGAAGGDTGAREGKKEQEVDLLDPERAREIADTWAGSPLEDLAFSTAGGLAVRMDPTDVPGAGRVFEVMLPIGPEDTEDLLSRLGYQARDAALANADTDFPLGKGLSTKGSTLDCQRLKCVALTFDDGPGEHTDALLDTLAEYDANATFYVLGSLVDEFPEALERMDADGHELGNHTWKHDDLSGLSADKIEFDLSRTNKAVRDVIGSNPLTLRPPYGSLNGTVRTSAGLPIILWDVDTLDWRSRDTDAVAEHALTHSTPGSVVLLHDIHETSVRAVPDVLSGLHRQGFHFVTVTELFGDTLEPGDVYTDARLE